jgi:4-amino-4-deoxy-L-arabinose transferase-like glycosyltransferase
LYEKWMRWKKYRNEIKAKSCGILFLLSSLLWSLFFFFLVGLGFGFRTSSLQRRHSIIWATLLVPPFHFATLRRKTIKMDYHIPMSGHNSIEC